MFRKYAKGLASAWLILAATASSAQVNNCNLREIIVERLADRWGESRQSMALAANGYLMEMWANPETGTWTLTLSPPEGPMCLFATGQGWQRLDESLPNTDEAL